MDKILFPFSKYFLIFLRLLPKIEQLMYCFTMEHILFKLEHFFSIQLVNLQYFIDHYLTSFNDVQKKCNLNIRPIAKIVYKYTNKNILKLCRNSKETRFFFEKKNNELCLSRNGNRTKNKTNFFFKERAEHLLTYRYLQYHVN